MGFTPIHRLLPPLPPASSDTEHVDHKDIRPQHDTGRICVDFENREVSHPEPLDRILDASLGRSVNIKQTGGSSATFSPEAIMRQFGRMARACIVNRYK
jgi:hypothetical protein